jgi:hypothetical protein
LCHHLVEDVGGSGVGHHQVDEAADGVGELLQGAFAPGDGGVKTPWEVVAHRAPCVVET